MLSPANMWHIMVTDNNKLEPLECMHRASIYNTAEYARNIAESKLSERKTVCIHVWILLVVECIKPAFH